MPPPFGSPILVTVPVALTTIRLVLGPVLLALATWPAPRLLFPGLVVLAFFTDWFDGIAARWLGVAYPWLRRYDIVADQVFYLSALVAAWCLEAEFLNAYTIPIVGLLIMEVTCQAIHLVRFHTMTATHAWSCKVWSVVLALALTVLLGWGDAARPLVIAALVMGYLAYLDVFLILAFARRVPVDVVSSYHVWRSERSTQGRL